MWGAVCPEKVSWGRGASWQHPRQPHPWQSPFPTHFCLSPVAGSQMLLGAPGRGPGHAGPCTSCPGLGVTAWGAGQGQPLSWAVLLPLWPPGSSRADRPLSSLGGTPEQLLKGAWSRPFCPRAPGTVHTGSPRTSLWAWSCPVRYGMFCNISGFPYPRNPKDVSRKTKCPLVATEEPWPGPPVGWGRGGEA